MKLEIDTREIASQMNAQGYVHLTSVLNNGECQALIDAFESDALYRKTVHMERHQYGKGRYRYFAYPLPELVENLRQELYPLLAPLANQWAKDLGLEMHYSEAYADFLELCRKAGQLLPTPLILQYEPGGYNTLHQDLYGEVYFPMQAIICLSQKGKDFTGGQLVLTEQRPRAQSKAIVIDPDQGDLIIIPTQFRPRQGSRGSYRVNMRHGVSEVKSGMRYTLGVILHEALK